MSLSQGEGKVKDVREYREAAVFDGIMIQAGITAKNTR